MATGNDILTLGIGIDSRDVVTASNNLDKLPASAGRAENATNSLSSSFGNLKSYIAAAAAAFGLFKLAEYAKEAAMLAARVETLGVVMKVVGANAGYTGSQMDAFTSGLKKMGITTQESMSSLIKMAGAQMDLTKASQLARVAQDAAVIGGINSSEAFGRMIQGIRSGEVEILKTIGINVQFEQGYKKMAESLGKTSNQLTSTEKTASRMNEVLAFGTNIAGAYEASMSTAGKQMLSMSRYTEELKLQIGQIFTPALTSVVTMLSSALKFVSNNFEQIKISAMAASTVIIGIGAGIAATNLAAWATTAAAAFTALRISMAASAGAAAAGNLVMIGGSAAMSMFGMATGGATVAFNALKVAMMANPVGLIVGTLVTAIGLWWAYARAQENAQRKIAQFDNSSMVGQLAQQNRELEKSLKLLTQTANQKSAESASQFQVSMNNLKKEELSLTNQISAARIKNSKSLMQTSTKELESKLWLVRRDIEYAPKLYEENARISAKIAAARDAKKIGDAPPASTKSSKGAEKAANAAEQWRKTYADLQLEIDKLNPAMDEHAQKIADISNKYADLANKKGANITKLNGLKTALIAATQAQYDASKAAEAHKLAMSDVTTELDKFDTTFKAMSDLQPGAGLDTLNQQIASFQGIADKFPEQAEKVAAAIQKIKEAYNESSGLNALNQANSDLEISMMKDPFEKQQALIDRAYEAKKAAAEKDLKLAAGNEAKKAAIVKNMELEKQKHADDTAANSEDAYKSQLSMVANYAGTAANLFGVMADAQDQSSREGFESAKAFNTAAAIMSTAAAIMNALATSKNIYVGVAMAALAAATGAIQIAKIQSTTFGGGGSVSAPSGTVAGSGTNGGGVAGAAIGARYVSIEDSQTTEALQKLADSAENASIAIGQIVDGFSKIEGIFSEGGYGSLFAGSAYGIDAYVPNAANKYNFNKVKNSAVGGSAMWSLGDAGGLTGKIGQYLGGALFGLGNTFKYKSSAMMMGGTSSGVVVADVDEYRKKGGMFGKGKTKYEIKYDSEWSEFLQGAVNTIGSSIQRMAITMGTKAQTAGVALPGAVIGTTGRTADAIAADVQKWLEQVAANLASTVPELTQFAFAGENYYLALTRLNDALVSTNQSFQMIGKTLITSTLSGANSAYKLQDLMGGSKAYIEAIGTYFSSMFTDAEQSAQNAIRATQQVANAFGEMGITAPTTREQFRALVNGLDVTTERGAQLFASLMGVSEAFATMIDQATALKDAQAALTQDLMSRFMAVNGYTDEAVSMAQLRISQQQEMNDATEQGLDTTALAIVQRMEFADALLAPLKTFADGLRSTVDGLTKYTTAQAFELVNTAIASGNLSDTSGLNKAVSVLSNTSADNYSTALDYHRGQALAQNTISSLSAMAYKQISDAQKSLEVAQNQLTALSGIFDEIKQLRTEIRAVATSTGKALTIFDKWDGDGMPAVAA